MTILSPQNGAVITTATVSVSIQTANFQLVNKLGGTNVPGQGHAHYYLDVQPPTDPSKPAIPSQPGAVWAPSAAATFTFDNVSAGSHTIYAQLVNNDHTPLSPNVQTMVMVTVQPMAAGSVIPPEVIKYASDWPLPQGDYAATRSSFSSTISASNVNTLGVAWTAPLAGGTSTNPIIMGNNVFIQDNAYNVWSIDFNTGKINWNVTNNSTWIGPAGVCVGWGKVFGSATSYDIAAWDMNTGKTVWETPISNANPYERSDIQPIPYNNMIFTSDTPHVGGTQFGGMSGFIFGVDQAKGKINWSWAGVDSANFWGHPELNAGGGAWFPPSIDVNTGIIYWGTKNPGGFGYGGTISGSTAYPNGYARPGPNLYTNAIIAQNSADGQLLWYNQTFPHDLVDHDFMNTPVLATAPNMYGMLGPIDIAIGGGKAGVVFAFDRVTGATMWSTPVGKHQYDTLGDYPLTTPLQLYPGVLGGVESHMAYADGVVFVPYCDLWTTYNAFGLQKVQTISEGTGGLAAIDVNNGKILWDNKLPSINVGAATVVNDLVFTSTYDGTLYAFNRSTGAQVWKYSAPAGFGINSWPSVARDTILFAYGVGPSPMLVAFKLGATGTIAAPPPPSTTPPPTPSGKTVNITINATNIKFDLSTITVPAGATVNITFNNNDAQVPHNVAFYTTPAATTRIFIGDIITGPATTKYTFTAPSTPGNYFFRCDVHPTLMTGTFVVTAQ